MKTRKSSKSLKHKTVLRYLEKTLRESREYEKKGKFWNAEEPHIKADYMLLDLIEALMENKSLAKKIRETFSKLPFWYA